MEKNENTNLNNDDNKEDNISIKSIEEKDNNNEIIEIIEKSNKNLITFKSTNNTLKINIKSIKKIFSLVDPEKVSDMYLDHITLNIFDFIPDKNKSIKDNNNTDINDEKSQNGNLELDIKFKNILDKATIFHISLGNDKLEADNNNNQKDNYKRTINRSSLKKIFNFMNKSIIDMSDYINLVILYLKSENQSDLAKLVIVQKILGKYNKEPKKIVFDGKKNFKCSLDIPERSLSQNIYTIDILFNKVLDFIDDYDKESSFSDNINNLIIPRKSIDEDLIQTANVCFVEEGILTNAERIGGNSENENKIRTTQEICNNDLCLGMCNIF